jgi:transposase InsO family protein
VKYAFIEQQLTDYPITKACAALSVTASGFHAWKDRPKAQRTLDAQRLLFQIKTLFNQYQRRYGAPRIHCELIDQYGYDGSLARVKRLMRQAGLRAKAKRKFKATTDSNHAHPIAANLLGQQFQAAGPNQVWLSDLTYIRTQEGWLYLAAVLDLYTREIVGWAMGSRMTQQLVIDALRMAWFRKHPGKHTGLVFHSDRGSQYASQAFRKTLKDYHLRQSMSGTGNCYDNAPMESFWHSLKVEEVRGRNYATREEATRAIVIYIEAFYNCERRHSSIDYRSPRQFEKQFYDRQNLNQNNSVKQSMKT